jgi:HSP20 family molecular chaperone IbpA
MRNPCPSTVWSPHYSIHERTDHYVLVFELAGLTLADISLTMNGHTVTLTGDRSYRDGTETRCVVSDIYCGRFETVVGLPRTVKGDHAQLHFENGLLRLTLPFDPSEPELLPPPTSEPPPRVRYATKRERQSGN